MLPTTTAPQFFGGEVRKVLEFGLAKVVLLVHLGPRVRDPHLAVGPVVGVGLDVVDLFGDLVALQDLTEHYVFSVQPGCADDRHEELGCVGVWSCK